MVTGLSRYFCILGASMAATFGLFWIWIATMPIAFMEPEFASWQAKRILLDRCELGDTLILGDSRAAADMMPGLMGGGTNLAIGGGEAIEALALLTRALSCPQPPRRLILSFDPGHFVRPDLFWERSVRFGFISAADIAALRATSAALEDPSVYEERHRDGIPSRLRDWLQAVRFPPYYFASLSHGGLFLRWRQNLVVQQTGIAARGHYGFGQDAGSDYVAIEGHLQAFQPLPVLDHYFNALLRLAEQSGVEVLFVAMPVNDATWQSVRPEVREAFTAYLTAYQDRYRHFHLMGEVMPHWPNRYFGDQFCHMNTEGARRFSQELSQRLHAAPPSTQNEAQNGWLSGTGRDASASVVPSSKRRS
jgi:hypothetical protein